MTGSVIDLLLFAQNQQLPADNVGDLLLGFAVTLAVFGVSFVLIYGIGKRILVRLTRRVLDTRGFSPAVVSLGSSIAGAFALVGGLAMAASVAGFGVVLAAFATVVAALSLAFGFAAQDLIANFVAGVFILKDEPFQTGDWIEWNGNVGVVREIDLRVTKLNTFDNELVTVPNSELTNNVVTNPVANDELRISYGFGISYDDDIDHAQEAITNVGAQLDGVLSDPEPAAPVSELGGSAVVLDGRVWIDPEESSAAGVKAAFVKAVKEKFDAEGIDMPYSHTELTGGITVTSDEASGISDPAASADD
ncbi:mechanosensitive ion channel family protein [Halorussus halophilus]|uniref:mechanosensitive ion channel family protein n=1 Tax=Halorussus halophilus TaxID=2650975 RepID=UPI00130186F8|nr:mechanosensitive ion channel domain-containing protein [Halorussus halophilus]